MSSINDDRMMARLNFSLDFVLTPEKNLVLIDYLDGDSTSLATDVVQR